MSEELRDGLYEHLGDEEAVAELERVAAVCPAMTIGLGAVRFLELHGALALARKHPDVSDGVRGRLGEIMAGIEQHVRDSVPEQRLFYE